jgi:phenylpyruvate tautomerase PptA (4-oxalocrotonate tautomerase family)
MSGLCKIFSKPKAEEKANVVKNAPEKIENKQEIIAAVTCAIAEELGEDIKGIRVKSFKRV